MTDLLLLLILLALPGGAALLAFAIGTVVMAAVVLVVLFGALLALVAISQEFDPFEAGVVALAIVVGVVLIAVCVRLEQKFGWGTALNSHVQRRFGGWERLIFRGFLLAIVSFIAISIGAGFAEGGALDALGIAVTFAVMGAFFLGMSWSHKMATTRPHAVLEWTKRILIGMLALNTAAACIVGYLMWISEHNVEDAFFVGIFFPLLVTLIPLLIVFGFRTTARETIRFAPPVSSDLSSAIEPPTPVIVTGPVRLQPQHGLPDHRSAR
jgi:hypothetical protein